MSNVWPRTAAFDDVALCALGGISVATLAQQFGTPLWLVDRVELVERMRAYRVGAGADLTVVYAAKALCLVGVLQLVAAEGLGLDVASGGELRTAVAADFPMQRVILHGNNKSRAELQDAVALGVGRIMVDSVAELDLLAEVAAVAGRVVDIALRITPGIKADTHAYIATGADDSKFGFTLSNGHALEGVGAALARPGLRLRGLHCHVGSQLLHLGALEPIAERMCALLAQIRHTYGVTLAELNVGGGLGIAYTPEDTPPSIGSYLAAVKAAVAHGAATHRLEVPQLTVEPGRSIVGPAGVTLYTIAAEKQIAGVRRYLAVDGGMSDNLRPALYGASYTFAVAGAAPASGHDTPTTVVGKHCESGDVLGADIGLPESLTSGGLLAVAATGAYSHSMASNYNRLPRPAMVLVGDGRADLLLRRETIDDVLARDVALPAEIIGSRRADP